MLSLIKEAEKRYPKGSVIDLGFGHTAISTGQFKESEIRPGNIVMTDEDGTKVYNEGKWVGPEPVNIIIDCNKQTESLEVIIQDMNKRGYKIVQFITPYQKAVFEKI